MPIGIYVYHGVKYSAIQRTFIESGVSRGMSANAIYRALRETGLGMRRQTVLGVVREIRNAEVAGNRLMNVRRDYRISEDLMAEGTMTMKSRYAYFGQIRGWSEALEQEKVINVRVNSDTNLTRGEIEENIRKGGDAALGSYNMQNITITITKAYRRPKPSEEE